MKWVDVTPWDRPLVEHRAALVAGGPTLKTRQNYASRLRHLAAEFPAGPWSVGPADLERWLAELPEGRRAGFLTAARSFYGWAVATGRIDEDPVAVLSARNMGPGDGFPRGWSGPVRRYAAASTVSPRSTRQRLTVLRRFASAHSEPWAVAPADVTAWVDAQSEGVRLFARQVLRSFYEWAVSTELTDVDPTAEAIARRANSAEVYVLTGPWLAAVEDFGSYLGAIGQRPATVRLRRTIVRRVARLAADPRGVTERDLLRWLSASEWSPETRRSASVTARQFFAWAVRYGVVDVDPAAGLPGVRVPNGKPRPTPAALLERALVEASDRDRLMVVLAAYAGLRRGEIAAVHPRDVIDGVLHVTGKGGRQRIIPVHRILADEIADELARRRGGRTGSGWQISAEQISADDYLFPGRRPGTHVQPSFVGDALSTLLGPGWSAHSLRHSFATRTYSASRDLRAVQELLGHSSPTTTAIYTAVPQRSLVDAVNAL